MPKNGHFGPNLCSRALVTVPQTKTCQSGRCPGILSPPSSLSSLGPRYERRCLQDAPEWHRRVWTHVCGESEGTRRDASMRILSASVLLRSRSSFQSLDFLVVGCFDICSSETSKFDQFMTPYNMTEQLVKMIQQSPLWRVKITRLLPSFTS